jgi:hypothetical protein
MHLLQSLLACAIAASLPAQTTWIVDQSGGPGTNFTDIPPAVAAASAGDVILVRPGSYSSFSVSKGVKILGQPSFTVASGMIGAPPVIRILDLPANETLVVANATISLSPLLPPTSASIQNALGHVHLQNVLFEPGSGTPGLVVSGSADVTVADCTFARGSSGGTLPVPTGFDPAVSVTNSDVTLVGSIVQGRIGGRFPGFPSSVTIPTGKSLVVTSSTMHLSRCDVVAGGDVFGGPMSAVIASASSLTFTGLPTNVVKGAAGAPAINADASSTVEIDTQLSVHGTAGGAAFVQRRIVTLDASGGTLGGSMTADAVSPEGDICILFLGVPYPPTPSPIGTLRINLATAVLIAQQVVPASGVTQQTVNIPNAVVLRGLLLGVQAANWDQTTGQFEASNAADVVLQ